MVMRERSSNVCEGAIMGQTWQHICGDSMFLPLILAWVSLTLFNDEGVELHLVTLLGRTSYPILTFT
jgi:hypothetical protein